MSPKIRHNPAILAGYLILLGTFLGGVLFGAVVSPEDSVLGQIAATGGVGFAVGLLFEKVTRLH